MPRFKELEEAYNQCTREGKVLPIPESEINLERVQNIIDIAEEDLKLAKRAVKDKLWNSGYKMYYDVLRELVEAFLSFDKIKSWNHQCLFAYLCKKHSDLELDWNFFEKVRTKRNGINYYGDKINENDWKDIKVQITLYISLFRERLAERLK